MSAKQDCETLLNAVLPFAKRMLKEFGEFYPYGGYMKPSGEVTDVGVEEDNEFPKSSDLLYVLRDSFSKLAEAGDCIATAIVLNVSVQLPSTLQQSNAIQVNLEHVDTYAAEVFFPYQINGDGHVTYGVSFAQRGEHHIFIC